MVFSSTFFLFYFLPIFLMVYFIVPKNWKNYVILVASIFFYAWGAPKFIFLVIGSLVINFYIVKILSNASNTNKKYLLIASLLINIGLLVYFKYANFFVENLNGTLNKMGISEMNWTKVALPIGISFFTFQSLTYTIDVYRKVHKPLDKLTDYLLYILMFPQLVAGPIVRFNTIADQIVDREKNNTIEEKLHGIYRFILGLSKKVLIANILGQQVDAIYEMNPDEIDTGLAWIAVIAYSFQIYFDFSGYSDMAIGIGRIIGFKFPENFNNPYISQSITEFWRRWHITLGAWMKDYLYIPLGGNQVNSKMRLYFNLWIVFLISGLWHGASWNFIIWGAYHGIFLVLDRIFLVKFLKKIGKVPAIVFTFFITLIGWVLFKIETLELIPVILKKMFSFTFSGNYYFLDREFWAIFIIAFIFSFIVAFGFGRNMEIWFYEKQYSKKQHIYMFIFYIVLLIFSSTYIATSGFNPFIYYRF